MAVWRYWGVPTEPPLYTYDTRFTGVPAEPTPPVGPVVTVGGCSVAAGAAGREEVVRPAELVGMRFCSVMGASGVRAAMPAVAAPEASAAGCMAATGSPALVHW